MPHGARGSAQTFFGAALKRSLALLSSRAGSSDSVGSGAGEFTPRRMVCSYRSPDSPQAKSGAHKRRCLRISRRQSWLWVPDCALRAHPGMGESAQLKRSLDVGRGINPPTPHAPESELSARLNTKTSVAFKARKNKPRAA